MRALYARVAELLAAGRAFKLARLVETRGSAPQRPGAKLLVYPTGRRSSPSAAGPWKSA